MTARFSSNQGNTRGRRPRLQSGNCDFPKSSPTFNCTRLICYVSAMAKSINIKNEEAASLVAELTAGTGKGTTELILELLRHEAESGRRFSNLPKRRKRIDAILRRARKKIPKDAPPTEQLIQFDRNGLPR